MNFKKSILLKLIILFLMVVTIPNIVEAHTDYIAGVIGENSIAKYGNLYDYKNSSSLCGETKVFCNGKEINENSTSYVKPGDKITIETKSNSDVAELSRITCKFGDEQVINQKNNCVEYTIPNTVKEGEEYEFSTSAVYVDKYRVAYEAIKDTTSLNPITSSVGIITHPNYITNDKNSYWFQIGDGENQIDSGEYLPSESNDITVKLNGKEISKYSSNKMKIGDVITIERNGGFSYGIGVKADYIIGTSTKLKTAEIKIDNTFVEGIVYVLKIWGTWTNEIELYYFTLEKPQIEEVNNKDIVVKVDGKEINVGGTIEVEDETQIVILAKPENKVTNIKYKIDNKTQNTINGNTSTVDIPQLIEGKPYNLEITAEYTDGGKQIEEYVIKKPVPIYDTSITVKLNNTTIEDGSTHKIKQGDVIRIERYGEISYDMECSNGLKGFAGMAMETYPASLQLIEIKIDERFEDGEKYKLVVTGDGIDKKLTYYLEMPDIQIEEVKNKDIIVKVDGKEINVGGTIEVEDETQIVILAKPENKVTNIKYKIDNQTQNTINGNTGVVNVSHLIPGKTYYLEITAEYIDGGKQTEKYVIKKTVPTYDTSIKVKLNNIAIEDGSTHKIKQSDVIRIERYGEISYDMYNLTGNMSFAGMENGTYPVSLKYIEIKIDERFKEGEKYRLEVTGDGINQKLIYYFEMPEIKIEEVTNKDIVVKVDENEIKTNTIAEIKKESELEIIATPKEKVSQITYQVVGVTQEKEYRGKIEIPNELPVGKYILKIKVVYIDNSIVEKEYSFIVTDNLNDNNDNQEESSENEEEKNTLLNEDWMLESKIVEDLSISLRNDSEAEGKANKNIYELNETVTYYIDYKNGEKDINDEIKITFEIPLDYKVINSNGGVINSYDEVEWIFKNGLKAESAGTIVIELEYTNLLKSRDMVNTIYPTASIKKGNDIKDISTVINMIIKDYNKKLGIEHYPYMFGDADKPTFRPDYSITRAEGALVLVRIFGVDYKNISTITNRYTDISETYYEAQQAITAATELAFVNGYLENDNTYTFKPNEKITKAEFMKILASMVEVRANQQGIEGLEVKNIDNLVKIYSDAYNKKTNNTHWAASELTLLARLNMLPLGDEYKEFNINDTVTRAEVTQLVNFYLLRAPVNITKDTNIQFIDVDKKHNLIADIIEATRNIHTFEINDYIEEK